MIINYCDACGKATTAMLNNVHNSWPTFDENGNISVISFCQECAEAVDAYVLCIEGNFDEYENIKPEFSRVDVEEEE
jgi:hypothetical protein